MSEIPEIKIEGVQSGNGVVATRERNYGPTNSLWLTAPLLEALQDPAGYALFDDDFYSFESTTRYALVTDTGGTAAAIDFVNGALVITNDPTDNDESYVSSVAENWKFAANKPLWFEARVKCVGEHNFIIGLSDTVGANFLQDTEAGPAASYDGAVFFNVGSANWQFETSNAATQVTNTNVGAFTSDSTIRLGFIFDPDNGTTGKITPYVNGVAAGSAHNITLAGLEEMHIVFGSKNKTGEAAVVAVDYVRVLAVRG